MIYRIYGANPHFRRLANPHHLRINELKFSPISTHPAVFGSGPFSQPIVAGDFAAA
jgi:hypothetical protein